MLDPRTSAFTQQTLDAALGTIQRKKKAAAPATPATTRPNRAFSQATVGGGPLQDIELDQAGNRVGQPPSSFTSLMRPLGPALSAYGLPRQIQGGMGRGVYSYQSQSRRSRPILPSAFGY